ncbi:MAG: ATP-dependent 6-phosphofructokinase [Propionibacteriaceae bacterium]|jgi:6-phosphofructokinase 1|nr:ATP-dependent 6-phosphofructokinase [Propionibacteriaceae bacterium]
MRIGLLTGGGDCPGLNGVIRSAVIQAVDVYADECVGFLDGWRGPLENDSIPLPVSAVRDILPVGGTILGTSRTNAGTPERVEQITANLRQAGVDALIPIGGEDTLGVAAKLAEAGVRCIGVPKTIDNDLSGTDVTFGFTTAVQIATDTVDRVLTTSASHHRAIVVEVMGRHAGWIALQTGLAGGACATLIPEVPFDVDEIAARVSALTAQRRPAVVVVAEGAVPTSLVEGEERILDEFGHVAIGGIAGWIAEQIAAKSGVETRTVVVGHAQRGGTPTAFDRVLTTRLGIAAVDALHRGESAVMVAVRGEDIQTVSLAEATGTLRTVPPELFHRLDALMAHT